jgi:hypothetical protein
MELEDLKQIWKKQPAGFEPKQETEIISMLQGRSNSIITKLKRNVWIELIFTIGCSIALGVYALTLENGAIMWTIISLLVLFICYLFYYVKKLMLLNKFDASDENLLDNLHHLYERLTVYVNFYKKSYSVLYPVYFCLGVFFGAFESGFDGFMHRMSNPLTVVYLVCFGGIFFIMTIIVTNVYLKKLYGNHLAKLKALLEELRA